MSKNIIFLRFIYFFHVIQSRFGRYCGSISHCVCSQATIFRIIMTAYPDDSLFVHRSNVYNPDSTIQPQQLREPMDLPCIQQRIGASPQTTNEMQRARDVELPGWIRRQWVLHRYTRRHGTVQEKEFHETYKFSRRDEDNVNRS